MIFKEWGRLAKCMLLDERERFYLISFLLKIMYFFRYKLVVVVFLFLKKNLNFVDFVSCENMFVEGGQWRRRWART